MNFYTNYSQIQLKSKIINSNFKENRDMSYTIKFKDGRAPKENISSDEAIKFVTENAADMANFSLIKNENSAAKPKRKKTEGAQEKKTRQQIEEEKTEFMDSLSIGQRNLLHNGYREVKYLGGAWGLVMTEKGKNETHVSVQEKKGLNIAEIRNCVNWYLNERKEDIIAHVCMKLQNVKDIDVENYINSNLLKG